MAEIGPEWNIVMWDLQEEKGGRWGGKIFVSNNIYYSSTFSGKRTQKSLKKIEVKLGEGVLSVDKGAYWTQVWGVFTSCKTKNERKSVKGAIVKKFELETEFWFSCHKGPQCEMTMVSRKGLKGTRFEKHMTCCCVANWRWPREEVKY